MRVRSLVFAVSVSALALAACTQSVESADGESSALAPAPPVAIVTLTCDNWPSFATQPDGFLVRLTPRTPRAYWSCPSVIVDGTTVEGLMTADLIAWYEAHPIAMELGCGVAPAKAFSVMYRDAWPAVTDPHQPYCVYEAPLLPLGDLRAAIDRQVGSQIAWEGFEYLLPLSESEPSGGSCPSCNERKLP